MRARLLVAGLRNGGVRRRFAPHQLRHAHAVEMAHEGVPLVVIPRQLGHSNLGITSVYLQGIDNAEIIDSVHARRAPMIRSEHRFVANDGLSTPLIARCSTRYPGRSRAPGRREQQRPLQGVGDPYAC